jgi:hypothetical protein
MGILPIASSREAIADRKLADREPFGVKGYPRQRANLKR